MNAQRWSERAARFCGAASVVGLSYPRVSPFDQIEYDHIVAAIRAQLDEATFAAAWAEGRQMTLDEAIAEALAESAVADGSSPDAKESSM
jgi:hypothetical protein